MPASKPFRAQPPIRLHITSFRAAHPPILRLHFVASLLSLRTHTRPATVSPHAQPIQPHPSHQSPHQCRICIDYCSAAAAAALSPAASRPRITTTTITSPATPPPPPRPQRTSRHQHPQLQLRPKPHTHHLKKAGYQVSGPFPPPPHHPQSPACRVPCLTLRAPSSSGAGNSAGHRSRCMHWAATSCAWQWGMALAPR